MIIAHRIQLDPTYKQAKYFSNASGCARFVWNWAITEWDRQYKEGGKPSGFSLRKEFNATKYEKYPWMKDVARDSHDRPFHNIQRSYSRFFKKQSNRPGIKCKGKSSDRFYVSSDRLRLLGKKVRIPIIGWVRMTEALRFTGKIMSATVSRTADKWFISINVDVGDCKKERTGNGTVGVDLGIKTLAVTSTGETFTSPMPLRSCLKKLARLNRSLHRKKIGSNNRNKARIKVARLHAKIRNIRQDCLHKATTSLCKNHAVVVIEDLCVKGMVRNRKLSRSMMDVGLGEFRRQLERKSSIYSTRIIVVSRWFPSSKTCSCCGNIKSELKPSERTYECEKCGLIIDRDLNAALNLRTAGLAGLACGEIGADCSMSSGETELNEAGTITCHESGIN